MTRAEKAALVTSLIILATVIGVVIAYAVPQLLQPHP